MPLITDPVAIKWANEELRPMAERLRDLNALVDDTLVAWFAGLNTVIPNSATQDLDDGREAEGVSRLTGADIHSFMTQVATIQTQFDGAGVMDVIDLPTVRALQV